MARIEDKLTAILHRITCPDPTELGEYHLGMLPKTRVGFIKQHLTECPHCTRELKQLETYLSELSPDLEHSLAVQIRILIARLIPDGLTGGPAPRPAFALRGDAGGPFLYEADEAQLTIEIQDDPGKPGRKTLLGLVIGVDPAGSQADLLHDAQLVSTAPIDDLGNFCFYDLAPGNYELILRGPEVEIHVQDLAV